MSVINKEFKDSKTYLNYGLTDVLMKSLIDDKGNIVYASLPSALAQQTIKKLHKNFKSFFSLLKKKQDLFSLTQLLERVGIILMFLLSVH